MSEQRGPMQRTAVLEEMLRALPPEVAAQVEALEKEQVKVIKPKPSLQRSATSMNVHEAGSQPTGAPSDISLQKRCASLETQLDKWVGIAQLLASELAYREKRLWDWQLDNTNTKAILAKFKDRLKKTKDTPGQEGRRRSPLQMPGPAPEREIGKDGAVMLEVGTPRQIPTSAAGISMLVVEADESHSKVRAHRRHPTPSVPPANASNIPLCLPLLAFVQALVTSCREIGYLVTAVASGEEALDRIYSQQRAGESKPPIRGLPPLPKP